MHNWMNNFHLWTNNNDDDSLEFTFLDHKIERLFAGENHTVICSKAAAALRGKTTDAPALKIFLHFSISVNSALGMQVNYWICQKTLL